MCEQRKPEDDPPRPPTEPTAEQVAALIARSRALLDEAERVLASWGALRVRVRQASGQNGTMVPN